ncbi:PAS domain-containing sensor histidine kinase [Methanobacterium spitsbergense]|uniref:PAS domain S-box protein n=1 Tax=Methanobacterium spitsbergense TaxID=2874285 RepID=A0A8T5UW60_9EURY|nr:PAS domain S-box protein [Methanobacterium spitsbergense]MBZ2166507.1 PAS domain S-box protein [Methanobacterium spitsbergense]
MEYKPSLSIKNFIILSFVIVISFALISILLSSRPLVRQYFSDIFTPLIELMVIIILFYATTRSHGRFKIAWILIMASVVSYTLGDIYWAILELGYHTNPFLSISDIFYLLFYPLFALGLYYLSRFSLNRSEKIKISLDMGIIIVTISLIFWTFLVIPALSGEETLISTIISIIYIIGDLLLFFVLLRVIYSKFSELYAPVIFLSFGILVQIFTDTIFALQTLQGTYISGGLFDTGWILSFVLIGIAAYIQASPEKMELKRYTQIKIWIQRSNFVTYLPLIWVVIAFTLLTWANENLSHSNIEIIEIVVGFIIGLVIIRQVITLNDNRNLYTAVQKENLDHKKTEELLIKSEKKYRELVDNSMVGVYKTDLNGDILFANNAMVKMFGYDNIEDIKTIKSTQLYKYPKDREKMIDLLTSKEQISYHDVDMVTKDGKTLTVLLSASLEDNTISGMLMDISERKKAEEALLDSEEKYRTLFEANPIYTILLDVNGKILDINDITANLSGLPKEELIGKSFNELDFYQTEDYSEQRIKFQEALNEKSPPLYISKVTINGNKHWIENRFTLLKNDDERSILLIANDITESKKAEKEIKSSLKEKENLLREIHHRVKNNMQIISSLLNLQTKYVNDAEAINVLQESQNRVKSMAMIHEKIYQSNDLEEINFADYIQSLISNLFYTYNIDKNLVKSTFKIENITLNMETAVPCGLIISELISNSLKYAFPNKMHGDITVSLKSIEDTYELMIKDNGIGLPEGLDLNNLESLGLLLVKVLTEQIEGELIINSENGTEFKIRFKELEYIKRF